MNVVPGGYAWWYVDGISDDGARAVSVIGFIGSVFSPWFGWSGRGDPLNHSCINIALYGRGGRWAMTERGREAVRRDAQSLQVGPSVMRWEAGMLVIDIDEIAVPHLTRLKGQIRLIPQAVTAVEATLDAAGAHVWRPFAPVARIEVALNRPGWTWNGHGYFDSNFGTRALEDDFDTWTWARLPVGDGAVAFYDADRRDGGRLELALSFAKDGSVTPIEAPPRTPLKRTFWRLRRETRAEPGFQPRQERAMVDAPFYSRSMIRTQVGDVETTGVHEALDLRRFAQPWLKPMIAMRIPRRPRWRF